MEVCRRIEVPETKITFCRMCHKLCGLEVDVEDDRIVAVRGDPANPASGGYTCVKGRQFGQVQHHPDRLLHSMKLQPDASHAPIDAQRAIAEISQQVADIIARHGPRAVALYTGTFHRLFYPGGGALATAWMKAIGSGMVFWPGTVDQPGKAVATALHGKWQGGLQPLASSDVCMLIGTNPKVSMWGLGGPSPSKRLGDARRAGGRLIVIDPRRTETALDADLFLQVKPGEDPTLLAGMLNVILSEERHDKDFAAGEVDGLETLQAQVAPFTPEYVARRSGVPADLMVEAARMFAAGPRGAALAGTGPNMSPRGNLTEYLILCLNTVCGRWLRAGERVPNPFVFSKAWDFRAQAIAPKPAWGFGEKLRVRGFTDTVIGLPLSAASDEILTAGDGQIRALICIGGNPAVSWPDQIKTLKALRSLELLVTIDPKMSATARLAQYVIAPKLAFESEGITNLAEEMWHFNSLTGYEEPYAMYTPALVPEPAGSDLVDDWELFWSLAGATGVSLKVKKSIIPNHRKPTNDEILKAVVGKSRVSLDRIKQYPHGHIFDDEPLVVAAKADGWEGRLKVDDETMMAELAEVANEDFVDRERAFAEEFTHRLISRRVMNVYNSTAWVGTASATDCEFAPAFLNPSDMDAQGISPGALVEVSNRRGAIEAIATPSNDISPGVVSIPHNWNGRGGVDARAGGASGSTTNRLIADDVDYDRYTGMPRLSSLPVKIALASSEIKTNGETSTTAGSFCDTKTCPV